MPSGGKKRKGRGIFDKLKDIVGKVPGPIKDIAVDLAKKELKKAVGLGKKKRRTRRKGKGLIDNLFGAVGLGRRKGRGEPMISEHRKVILA